jgi:hypothetical protein
MFKKEIINLIKIGLKLNKKKELKLNKKKN